MSPLVNPAALFRFRFPCRRREKLWPPDSWGIDEGCRLPSLGSLAGVPDILDLFVAWNPSGLAFRGIARGVGKDRWCHPAKPEDSDGLHLWIATRPTGDSHRAGRFCRRLAVLPTGGGPRADRPVIVPAMIPMTSELPAELPEAATRIESKLGTDGWQVDALLAAAALPGWDPAEIPRLGFFAAVVDRRLGRVPCYAPPEYPWEGDPTTWAELELAAS